MASQNLLSFSERRDLREEGEETLRAFFESLSEAEQHRYVDGTTEQHLKKVVKILDNMSEDTRKAISARLRRELGGRGERPREGQGGPPPGGAPGSVEGGLDELAGMALEMQYRDAKPARKLEMAQMLDNMQSFLQGFRR